MAVETKERALHAWWLRRVTRNGIRAVPMCGERGPEKIRLCDHGDQKTGHLSLMEVVWWRVEVGDFFSVLDSIPSQSKQAESTRC
jgi:hypothetical protein